MSEGNLHTLLAADIGHQQVTTDLGVEQSLDTEPDHAHQHDLDSSQQVSPSEVERSVDMDPGQRREVQGSAAPMPRGVQGQALAMMTQTLPTFSQLIRTQSHHPTP